MNHFPRFLIGVLVLILSVNFMNCSSSGSAAKNSSQEESEEDVLKLLGISEEGESEPSPDQRITSLEEQLRQREAEINELKSQLVLKDEQIAELRKNPAGRPMVQGVLPEFTGDFNGQYQQALNLYNSGRYQDSINLFSALLARNMTHSLSDNCQYWIGESYYALRNFRQAIVEFEKVFTFPQSNKDPDAQLKLGLCHWNLGDTARAKEEFNRLLVNFPDSEYSSRAQSYLAQLGQ